MYDFYASADESDNTGSLSTPDFVASNSAVKSVAELYISALNIGELLLARLLVSSLLSVRYSLDKHAIL